MKGRVKVIAIKENYLLCPWADVVYGCDSAWWAHRRGLPKFAGLKVSWSGSVIEAPDVKRVEIALGKGKHRFDDALLLKPIGTIGGGGNSGFQALNLAAQFGAKSILLIGFDMSDRSGVHWYGRNNWIGANNPDETNFVRWVAAFNAAAVVLKDAGISVLNASRHSAIKCFPKGTVNEFIQRMDRVRPKRIRCLRCRQGNNSCSC